MACLKELLAVFLLVTLCPISEPLMQGPHRHNKGSSITEAPVPSSPESPAPSSSGTTTKESTSTDYSVPSTPLSSPVVASSWHPSASAEKTDGLQDSNIIESSLPARQEKPKSDIKESVRKALAKKEALLQAEKTRKRKKNGGRRATENTVDPSGNSSLPLVIEEEHCGKDLWCGEGSNKCIPRMWVCDNMNDCISGIDELDCNKTFRCPANTLVCLNGRCVDAHYRCNGMDDCGDSTDETNCPIHSSTPAPWCPDNMYRCTLGPCISTQATCDGFRDCPQGEDESGCVEGPVSCEVNKFMCEGSGNCIPVPWVCDQNRDCPDGSDEIYCDANGDPIPHRDHYFQHTVCRKEQFACHDGGCIDRKLLCDGHWDCEDRSDEGGLCNQCQTKGCEWKCVPNPMFPACECPEGKVLNAADERTCLDVDECRQGTSGCHHYCRNEEGGFECYCAPGYRVDSGDGKKCLLEEEDKGHLYVSVNREVRKLPLFPEKETGDVYAPVVGASHRVSQQVFGLDFDTLSGNLYLALAESGGQRGEIHYLSSDEHRCLISGFQGLSNVAVDWITANIYYTVSGASNGAGVGVCSGDGRFCRMLITGERIHRVRALALHPRRRQLYWSDWDDHMPRIEVGEMDGSNQRILVGEKIGWPNGLAVDYVRDHLYWADGDLQMIERIDLNTETRHVVMSRGLYHANEILVFDDTIFWGDWELGSVLAADVWNVSDIRVVENLPNIPLGLAIQHPVYQDPEITNYCLHSNCTHLCVLSASAEDRHTCLCPWGYREGREPGTCWKDYHLDWLDERPGLCMEEFLRQCSDGQSPCMNGGSCVMERAPKCQCVFGFEGDYCEYSVWREGGEGWREESGSLGWLASLLIVAVILLILGVLVGVYIRKTVLGRKYYRPSQSTVLSTPLKKQSAVSFARFRRQQKDLDREKERMVSDGVSVSRYNCTPYAVILDRSGREVCLGKMESFGNPLYEEEFGNPPNVHTTVLALNPDALEDKPGTNLYYSIVDSDSGIDQISADGSGSP